MTFAQALELAILLTVGHYFYYFLFLAAKGFSPEEANLLLYKCHDRAFFQAVALLSASFFF